MLFQINSYIFDMCISKISFPQLNVFIKFYSRLDKNQTTQIKTSTSLPTKTLPSLHYPVTIRRISWRCASSYSRPSRRRSVPTDEEEDVAYEAIRRKKCANIRVVLPPTFLVYTAANQHLWRHHPIRLVRPSWVVRRKTPSKQTNQKVIGATCLCSWKAFRKCNI